MKGIILAGGTGTRLLPLTKITNKHLLPICDKSMIFYPLETLQRSGIREVLITTDRQFLDQFKKMLGNGEKLGMRISFAIQENPDGIAGALKLAKKFVGDDSMMVILGDNIFENDFLADVQSFKFGAKIFLKQVHNPERFGVAELIDEKVVSLQEKPKNSKSDLAVVGVYFYDKSVFDIIAKIKPSTRGELEITDVNNFYLKEKKLLATKIKGFWSDAGTFESLAEVTKFIRERGKN
jgi:glucose-1-phosphate thymidylyltransferase